MTFDIKNVHTTVNADECKILTYGYFANDLESLRATLYNGRTCLRTVYTRLEGICAEKFEKRFVSDCGVFALFYPTDLTENELRY